MRVGGSTGALPPAPGSASRTPAPMAIGATGSAAGATGSSAGATGSSIEGWPAVVPFEPTALVLLADPFSFPVEQLFAWLADNHPGLPVLGGNASAARGPGGNRLALDEHVAADGAVGVLLGPGVDVTSVVSQGCRPVGEPFVITSAEDDITLPAVPGQQQRPRTLDDGVDGEVVVLGDLPYPVGDAGG